MPLFGKGTFKITGFERDQLERVRTMIRTNGIDAAGKTKYSKIHITSSTITLDDFPGGKAHGMKVKISKPRR